MSSLPQSLQQCFFPLWSFPTYRGWVIRGGWTTARKALGSWGWGIGVSCLSLPLSGSDSQFLIPACSGIYYRWLQEESTRDQCRPLSQCFSYLETLHHPQTYPQTRLLSSKSCLLSPQASDIVTTSYGCCHKYTSRKSVSWHTATLCQSYIKWQSQ